MRLLVVRHGETLENARGIIQGQSEGTLSPEGLRQSRALAKRLAGEALDYAYCSDLIRARGTMAEIIRGRDLVCEYTKALRELGFGEMEGRPVALYFESLKRRAAGCWPIRPQGGESYDDFGNRIEAFVRRLVGLHRAQSLLICSHGWSAKFLIGRLMNLSIDDICALECANASLSILDLNQNLKVTRSVLNDTGHLNPQEG